LLRVNRPWPYSGGVSVIEAFGTYHIFRHLNADKHNVTMMTIRLLRVNY